MSATDISKMNDKQLRNEVQLLRDELAIMKRQYEDIIYNLDDDNFSSRFVKEKGDMRTAIEVNAEGIKTKVSNEDFESEKKQTASLIESEVKKLTDADTEIYTKISQTADAITSEVTNRTKADEAMSEELSSKITQTATSIMSEVQSATETINGRFADYTTIEQTAKAIKTHAYASADLSSAKEITKIEEATDTSKTYYISTTDGSRTYYYYNDISKKWEEIGGGGIETVFEQTAEGFKLKGNVKVDGSCILTDSLTFDASDKPVQVEYSADGTTNWHTTFISGSDKFMRLKIGSQWSDPMKVVGSDGQDGQDGQDGLNGSNATVTPDAVFKALTANGANQGIFAAFVNKENQIYINAEMIGTNYLKIGDENSVSEEKKIVFNDAANIRTFLSKAGYHYGLAISSNGLNLEMKPDYIKFIDPNVGSFSAGSISLADYVASYGGGSGTGGVAKFG